MTVSDRIASDCGMDLGSDLDEYISKLGWSQDAAGVVDIPPNPDNKIVSTVVQENIQLPRTFIIILPAPSPLFSTDRRHLSMRTELSKVISHVIQAA